ncbi:MAG: tetratricopeptide repeat protein, partial [Bradymonadia bacterium]
MQRFRTVYRIPTLILVLCFWTVSNAQTEPYVDWVFDFEQAQKGDDAEAVSKLITSQPALARVWFYGFVYDVVNKGVPVGEQAAIRSRCDLIARTLATLGPREQGPQRVMERLGEQSTETFIQSLRLEEERWANTGPELGMLPLQLSVVNNPVQAAEVFYRALFKAAKWKTKLGGVDKAAKYVTIARRIASGFALAFGDDRYWRGLATYLGQKAVPIERLSFVEQTLGKALNQQISMEAGEAYRAFEQAFASISKTRQDSLLVGLAMNGLAASATRAKKAARGLSLREQLAAGVRPLQLKSLTQLINGQLIESYLAVGKLDQARRGVDAFVKTLDETKLHRHQIDTLLRAIERFEAESNRALADGKLSRAITFGQASVSLLDRMIKPVYGNAYFLRDDVDGARLKHQGQLADAHLRLAEAHRIRGDYTGVDAALTVVQGLYRGPLSDRMHLVLDLELIKIEGLLEQGLFDKTEAALDVLRGSSGIRDETFAAAHRLSALQFYLRGAYAPAFAHANEGLAHLHARNVKAPAVYGSLHHIAALTLEAAGFTSQAIERWTWVNKFAPSFEATVQQARLLARGGELEKAAEKLEPYFETEHARKTTVIQSCLLASTPRHEEARASLSVLVPQLSLPTSRRFRAAGYACLAQMDAKANQYRDALKRIEAARRSLKGFPSPNLRWRIDLI